MSIDIVKCVVAHCAPSPIVIYLQTTFTVSVADKPQLCNRTPQNLHPENLTTITQNVIHGVTKENCTTSIFETALANSD